jgi:hypothetical protein
VALWPCVFGQVCCRCRAQWSRWLSGWLMCSTTMVGRLGPDPPEATGITVTR